MFPGLNKYETADKASCSRKQHSVSDESPTNCPSLSSTILYHCASSNVNFYWLQFISAILKEGHLVFCKIILNFCIELVSGLKNTCVDILSKPAHSFCSFSTSKFFFQI